MGSLRPSVRVKGANSGPMLANGLPGSHNGPVREELRVFESDNFDANAYVQGKCQSMSEKGMRQLCAELQDLKKASAEEMRRSVYANYGAFIRTSRELSDLEGELLAMRNLLSSQAALIHGLAEGTSLAVAGAMSGSAEEKSYLARDPDLSELELRAQALPDLLDVLSAERKIPQALLALEEGERLVMEGQNPEGDQPYVAPLQAVLTEQRTRLAEHLAETAIQPSVRGAELRSAIATLDKLGDGPRAHSLLLKSHHERLKNSIRTLRPSGISYGGAYTAALSQLVFSAIAQAVGDSVTVFGEETSYASELVLWARQETENFAALVKRNVLSSSAAAGGLRAAAEYVQIALGHCLLLEGQGLALSPILTKLLRPSVEQALDANLRRIEESVAALAAADDWILMGPPSNQSRGVVRISIGSLGSAFALNMRLTSSAHRFNIMVQDFLEDVSPLINMQLSGHTLDGLCNIFEAYIGLLLKAMPALQDDDEGIANHLSGRIVQSADTLAQQLTLLGNAAALADELLPRAASKLVPSTGVKEELSGRRGSDRHLATRMPELKDWKRRLQRGVDKLRDHFCQQHTLDLIYSPDDVDAQLSTETYLSLDMDGVDGAFWHQDPMPSRTFQAFFATLTNISQTAADLLPGRERMITVLLMRLTETIVIWLSNDEDFWEMLEEGVERTLGPNGLKQFVLDMQFVIQVASYGRYSSRNLRQVVSDITSRAVNAYAATGADPDNVLPDDEWFLGVAKEALHKLLSSWTRDSNANGDLGSPTHSISSQSVSSMT